MGLRFSQNFRILEFWASGKTSGIRISFRTQFASVFSYWRLRIRHGCCYPEFWPDAMVNTDNFRPAGIDVNRGGVFSIFS